VPSQDQQRPRQALGEDEGERDGGEQRQQQRQGQRQGVDALESLLAQLQFLVVAVGGRNALGTAAMAPGTIFVSCSTRCSAPIRSR